MKMYRRILEMARFQFQISNQFRIMNGWVQVLVSAGFQIQMSVRSGGGSQGGGNRLMGNPTRGATGNSVTSDRRRGMHAMMHGRG